MARRIHTYALVVFLSAVASTAQQQAPNASGKIPVPQLRPGSERPTVAPTTKSTAPEVPQQVSLTVPRGTPIQVVLEKEVRIRKVGQGVEGRVVEPIYAFDRIVVPSGTKVRGEVTKIQPLSGGKRTVAGLDEDFTPAHPVEVRFTDIMLSDGKHIPVQTSVTPGSGQVLKFTTAPDKESKKTIKDVAAEKTKQAKQQAKDEWNNAMKQLKTPGRLHRAQRYVQAQLPVHPQYIPAGTTYFAELEEPLEFGSEPLTTEMAKSLEGALPEGAVVHARLMTPLSSATAQKGQDVEAVLTRPLLDGERLVLPQGSRLKGTVRQVQAARWRKRNGQLRIAFEQLVPPDGLEQKVQATLVGVEAGKDGNVKLDSEGGAEATTSNSRYLATAVSLGLASLAGRGDPDSRGPNTAGNPGGRMAGGLGGFKLLGLAAGAMVQSRIFGYVTGAYGAGMSIYRNFMARGHEVVFPKNTAMEISIGTRAAVNPPPVSGDKAAPSLGAGDTGQ